MWISHSKRPLNVNEICHALAVEIGSADINTNNVPSIQTVLGCCQGLATVDKGSSTIRLIHFTLNEYLSCHADLFDRPHSRIAETCLTYLNFQAIKDLSASPSRDPRGMPFLEYSSLYWGIHMQMELSDRSRFLALDLLGQYDNHISAELLWKSIVEWCFRSLKPFPPLHCISYFGITEVTIDLIRTKRWDVNQRDSAGATPLMWAARYGHEEVVKLLLQQKHMTRQFLDRLFANLVSTGSWWGEVRAVLVMSVLLGVGWIGTILLMLVIYEGVLYVWRPFSPAAESGHEGAIWKFLGRLFTNFGNICHWWREVGTLPAMILIFVAGGIGSLLRPANYDRGLLSLAAENGHDGVVKLLLEQEGVSPDRPDIHGQTPLSWAARNGHDGVVKLLLGREDVSPDKPNNYDKTPLLLAAKNGHDGVVKLLLEREDVSPDRPDIHGQTPLSWAAQNGHREVVKLVLERDDVIPDRPDNGAQTPLWWAATNAHDGVVKLLLGREDVSPDKPNNYDKTPLLLAAKRGHYGVVKLLLEREDVSTDRPDNSGHTPLSWAARNGHDGVVKLLKAREAATSGIV